MTQQLRLKPSFPAADVGNMLMTLGEVREAFEKAIDIARSPSAKGKPSMELLVSLCQLSGDAVVGFGASRNPDGDSVEDFLSLFLDYESLLTAALRRTDLSASERADIQAFQERQVDRRKEIQGLAEEWRRWCRVLESHMALKLVM